MEITINGKQFEVTDAIKTYAEEKIAKLPRHYDRVSNAELIIQPHGDHHGYLVELITHVEQASTHVAQAHHDDVYHAIVEATKKMERQLTDIKEKVRSHH